MAIFNTYEVDVDLKREYTTRQISFAQAESGMLVFRIFDDGQPYDMTNVTRAMIYQNTPSCMRLENEAQLTVENGMTVVKFFFEKITTIETGFHILNLTLYDGDYVVNIKPFNVFIYPNMQGIGTSYLELIQDMLDIIDNLTLDLNNTIKLIEKGVPNGVATLDANGHIPVAQMPTSFQGYLDHIPQTVYLDQVHGMLISDDGILQYVTPEGIQNAGFSPEGLGNPPDSGILNATITVNNGIATVLYTGNPTVVAQKWAQGERELAYFVLAGNTFAGTTFPVNTTGLYTLWYRDSNANTYVVLFNVTQDELKNINIGVTVDEGLVTVDVEEPVTLMKWDTGVRDLVYFQYNGNVVTGNTFNVTNAGTYTVYVKLATGGEYIKVFTVADSGLPTPDTTPPTLNGSFILINNGNGARITVTATDTESGVNYITTPDMNQVYNTTTTYEVNSNGDYVFKATDNSGNVGTFTITVTGINLTKPTITLSSSPTEFINGNVVITAIANSTTPNGNIVLKKWAEGQQDETYFVNNGNVFTVNTFTVVSNGWYTVYAEDNNGAKNVAKIRITNIDRLAPTIVVMGLNPSGLTSGNVIVELQLDDQISGIAETKWAEGDRTKEWFRQGNNGTVFTGNSFIVTENGTYTIYGKDNVGNDITELFLVNNIKREAPSITLNYTPDNYTNGIVTILSTIVVHSGTLDVAKWAQGSKDVSYFSNSGNAYNGSSFTITENGQYTVYAKDSIGNQTTVGILINTIDNTKPTITSTEIASTSSSKTFRITASDAESGLNRIVLPDGSEYDYSPVTFTVNADGAYTFMAYDNAGNFRGTTEVVSGLVLNQATTYMTGGEAIVKVSTSGVASYQGNNVLGKGGYGSLVNETSSNTPKTIDLTGIVKALTGDKRSFFLNSLGEVYMAGSNILSGNSFSTNLATDYAYPERIYEITGAVDIVSGVDTESLFYKKSNGDWYAMGKNDMGQLGLGFITVSNGGYLTIPEKINTFASSIKQIAYNASSTIFLLEDGYTWFVGKHNLPIDGTQNYVPERIMYQNGVRKWKFVTLNETARNAYFITDDAYSNLYVMGLNQNGELGLGHASTVTDDGLVVSSMNNLAWVSAGNTFAIFVKIDGTVYGTGNTQFIGQGQGGNVSSPTPISIGGQKAIYSSSGRSTSIIVTDNGRVYGGGFGAYNVFGNGTNNIYNSFDLLSNIM